MQKNKRIFKATLVMGVCFVAATCFSSCGLHRGMTISTDGRNANVSGGVFHPTTNEPIMIEMGTGYPDQNKYQNK